MIERLECVVVVFVVFVAATVREGTHAKHVIGPYTRWASSQQQACSRHHREMGERERERKREREKGGHPRADHSYRKPSTIRI
jgi:hypothetical protein